MESSKPIITVPGGASIIFFIVISFIRTGISQTPNYVGDDCHNKTPQDLTASYKANLNQLLSRLSNDASMSKHFSKTTIGNTTNAAVYGLYDCRDDVAEYFCQFCVSTATREVLQRCPDQSSAVIWSSYCILRYSNENFFGKAMMNLKWIEGGAKKVFDPTEGKKAESYIRSLIGEATGETKRLSAWGELNLGGGRTRYAMVQCSKDLTGEGCKHCLEVMLNEAIQCCEEKQDWQVGTPSCMVQYTNYLFYQTPAPHNPKTANNGVSKSKALIISASVLVTVTVLSFYFYLFKRSKRRKDETPSESNPIVFDLSQRDSSLNTDLPTIPLVAIQQSTHHFSEDCKLGEGGFGPVYKGTLPDGREIAVKRLSQTSSQGTQEFMNEVIFIAKLQHRNLVRLLGCCVEENEKLLVLEYMPNSSLDSHLFNEENRKKLDWKQRLHIINGIARGLLYLHEDSRLRVIHRDLKASNILLDYEMNPKISDFGLARTFEGSHQRNTRRIMGTYGYMALEYAMEGLFSVKSDVFSFEVLLLEIICGKRISGFYLSEHGQSLLFYAWNLWCEGKCLELMDPMLENSYIANDILKCIHIGLLCVQEDATNRPTMSTVVIMLASDTMTFPRPNRPAFSAGRMALGDSSTSKNSKYASINEVTLSHIKPR